MHEDHGQIFQLSSLWEYGTSYSLLEMNSPPGILQTGYSVNPDDNYDNPGVMSGVKSFFPYLAYGRTNMGV